MKQTIKLYDFHGGIHPPENKLQSTQVPIAPAGIPAQLRVPLNQHIGAEAKPIVSLGQQVLKGECIAAANGFISAAVHAPTSGTVTAIESLPIPHPSGLSARCIVIDSDGEDRWIDRKPCDDYRALPAPQLLQMIRDAGIAGMGGAGFPSAVKLQPQEGKPIDTLIINGTECEPYITADDMLMRERASEVIAGVEILHHLIKPSERTVIGIEDNKPEAIAALQQAIAASALSIELAVFATKYPSGGEKQLIEILTGRQVPSGGLPADIGIVCQNVGTTTAIHRAINLGEPLISRITTVTGEACQSNRNFEVLIGTPVSHLLQLCDFDASRCDRLVMGGPMMGYTLPDSEVPIIKTSNCILAADRVELPLPPPAQACIRCGLCAEACPASLLPQQLYWFARAHEWEKLESHQLFDCIECGACSYVCPSSIPLVQYYRAGKAELKRQQQDHLKAEHAKLRFEARQQRLEQEQQEKEARRKARQQAAKAKATQTDSAKVEQEHSGDEKADIIAAAIARSKAKKQPAEATPDLAQQAIERAKARRSQPAGDNKPDPAALAEQLAKAETRLQAAQDKLAEAEANNSNTVDAMRTAVSKMTAKRDALQQQLQAAEEN